MSWEMIIGKGSTLRVPLMFLDEEQVPITFLSASLTLTPDDGSTPISLTQVNSKLVMTVFTWIGKWSSAANYNVGDVVRYQGEYYRCVTANTDTAPLGSNKWDAFAQFTILISAVETAGYAWAAADYQLDVEFSNSDVQLKYFSGRAHTE